MNVSVLTYNIRGLPWVRDQSVAICDWILKQRPPILCLQEVFRPRVLLYFKEKLEGAGYHVCLPKDDDVTLMKSGLLTACLSSDYDVLSSCFYPYLAFHNVEIFANKGFQTLVLRDRRLGRTFILANTHMQSDTEVTWFLGREGTYAVRKAQHQQIVDTLMTAKDPAFLIGDLNIEHSPHSSVRYMTLPDESRLQKSTFIPTGENLDHCAWFPLQWAAALASGPGCSFCDFNRRGPRMTKCQIYQVSLSDHAPVLFTFVIPRLDDLRLVRKDTKQFVSVSGSADVSSGSVVSGVLTASASLLTHKKYGWS